MTLNSYPLIKLTGMYGGFTTSNSFYSSYNSYFHITILPLLVYLLFIFSSLNQQGETSFLTGYLPLFSFLNKLTTYISNILYP